jgi:hypothetical protein
MWGAVFAALSIGTVVCAGAAHADGGNGASPCSVAGNPAIDPNPGAEVRGLQPFGGVGNGGSNPGLLFHGFSVACRP